MDPKIITYLQLNPYYVYGENETPLQTQQKTEKYFSLPSNLRLVCIETGTSEKIKEIVIDRYSLTTERAKKISHLTRLVFFGELPISDFINRIKSELQIDINIAQRIALDINKEIFHKVAPELKDIQKKFQQTAATENRTSHRTSYGTSQVEPPRSAGQRGTPSAPSRLAGQKGALSAPPKELPTLQEEYEEIADSYLEPVTEKDMKPNPLIEGNVVNLKSKN